MSIIKITGSGAYEHTQETNHSLEYLKRALTEHKIKPTLAHPDGSVTEEKLSAEVRDRMSKHESDIQELNEKKADKSELDTKADKATVYTKSETDTILSTKADKATTYTIAQTDTILSTKADKSYTYTKAEVDSIANDVKEKVDDYLIPETSSLSAQLIYVGEHKADRSELPTKVSQLENDKNYVNNADYATADVGGVVKVGQYQKGLYIIPDTKQLSIYGAEKNDVETKTTSPRPILPYRVDYAVSKSTHQTMADEYDTTTMYVNDTSMVGAQGQLPASYDAVKTYVDDGLTSKADKTDLDWKLIGEEEVTAADITAAGEAGVTAVTIDFGKPIDSWYSETMVITAIPISSAINNFTNGKLAVVFGKTEEGAINRSDGSPALVASQGNNALLTPAWNQQHIITSNWLGKKDLTHSYVNYKGYNASTGYVVTPYTTENFSNKADSILNCRYLAVIGSYNVPNTNPVEKIIFKFPAGSKISIYGRM